MVKGGVEAVVPFSKLLYVDSLKRMVRIHTSDTVLEAAESFMAVSGRLMPDSRFLCCNRGIYVNMDWIQEVGDSVIRLKNGETLPVRVRGRAQVKKEYMEYALRICGGKMKNQKLVSLRPIIVITASAILSVLFILILYYADNKYTVGGKQPPELGRLELTLGI